MADKARVLIVDDDREACRTLGFILHRKGYDTQTAQTIQGAKREIQERSFDIVLVDLRLPDGEGISLLAPIRQTQPNAAVIVVTGYSSLETAMQAIKDGASDYLLKPLDLDEVLRTFEEILEKQRLVVENQRLMTKLRQELEERKQLQGELRRTNRALRVVSECNRVLVHATDEAELLQKVCELTVNIGGYRMAWAGYVEQDRRRRPCPMAEAGYEAGYFDILSSMWGEANAGWAFVEETLRTGQTQRVRDIATASSFAAAREEALERGYASAIALPLVSEDQRMGVLVIYASQADDFDPDEVRLLQELADDLAYGIVGLRLREERQETVREMHRLSQFLQSIIDSASVWMMVLDPDLNVVLWNKAAEAISGYSFEEVTTLKIRPATLIPEEDRRDVTAKVAEVLRRNLVLEDYEQPIRCRDGQLKTISWNARKLVDETGQVAGLIALGRDITERKRAAQRHQEMQSRVEQQSRLAAVGQLAAGITHDFNNILTAITGYAQILLANPDLSDAIRSDVEVIEEQGTRAARLIRQMLDFSRQSVSEQRPLNLASFMKETIKLLQRAIPENIQIESVIEPGEHTINADPTQMQEVLTNLALNARDAMPEGGTLRFELTPCLYQPEEPKPFPEMEPAEWLMLAVSDTGTGIPADVLNRVFEPFFTTKAQGKGSGLGLSQVYGIVQQHHGFIDVTSESGQGALFTIYLPAFLHAKRTNCL